MQLVKYDQPRYLTVAKETSNVNISTTITLWPGINELTDDEWNTVSSNPVVKHIIAEGHLRVIKRRPGEESILKGLTQEQAVKLVNQTDNLDLLKKWGAEDRRPLVLSTISAKLNKMVMPDRREQVLGKPPKRSKADDFDEDIDDDFENEFDGEPVRASAPSEDSEFEEQFPRADKLGHDRVAKKMAGPKATKAKRKR